MTMETERQERLNKLSPAKRALLVEALQRSRSRDRGQDGIPRRAGSGPAELSFSQQRLWLLAQIAPGSAAYNMSFGLRLEGELDIPALEKSLLEIERRHEVLRSVFLIEDDAPIQAASPPGGLRLPFCDLCSLPASQQSAEAEHLMRGIARLPFDLERGPLLRLALVRLDEREHLVLACFHHIVFDGWSQGLFVAETAQLYDAFRSGGTSPLPELALQYADYAVWQRQWLQGERLEALVRYWTEQLEGAPRVLDLPTDRLRPAVRSFRGGSRSLLLSRQLAEEIKEFGRRHEATLFMTLLAAFSVLLSRWSDQEDLLIGSPVANRRRPELEPLIGCFVNTLVLRASLQGGPGFRQVLAGARATALDAFEREDLQFEILLDALRLDRELSRSPLFQVAFVLQNAPQHVPEGLGLALSPVGIDTGTAKFDLTLSMVESEQALEGAVEYDADLFDDTTVERLTGWFRVLLTGLLADPERRVTEVPLLTEGEVSTLLSGARGTGVAVGDECLHEIFEHQAMRRPEAVALVCGDERLTYGELDRKADRLARRLRAHGVGPEVRVGLCLDRSIDLVIGVLAILKAGGAYVPLDPVYPTERLAFMLEDSGACTVLTRRDLANGLPSEAGVVFCDDLEPSLGEERPARSAAPGNAAYVIYTSGSSGRPKGVVVSHANVLRLFAATSGWFGFGAGDVWTLFHSYAFDFSVWELWGALLHGGRLAVVPYLTSRSPEAFLELLAREEVTVLNQTPSAFLQLIRAEEGLVAGPQLALRSVIFGGEALEPRSLDPWFARHGDERPRLVNMYGITETTVHVTYRPLSAADLHGASGSMIGVAIPDLRLYLLDRRGQMAPLGVPAELHVGGAGLARGYLGRSDLTAERFVPDPFGHEPGARLYRTGDRARYRPDGDLEYLGRIDQQVKIRGFRIEPGEVEVVLAEHPDVEAAVVVVHGTGVEKRLVGYVVPRGGDGSRIETLRTFLRDRLPDYMLPSSIVRLDALPLTPNGKLDRGALPEPDSSRPELAGRYAPPRTVTEELLVAVWAEVLGIEQIGIDDNFFDLGGDSMRALQVTTRGRRKGLSFALQEIYQYPSVRELAARLTEILDLPVEDGEVVGNGEGDSDDGELARLLAELESLSAEEVERRLRERAKLQGEVPG